MITALYVPLSDVAQLRKCLHCKQQVPHLPSRYYARYSGGLKKGVVRISLPHRAPCGAHCAGASLADDYCDGDPVHSSIAPCAQCRHLRRGSAAP